MIDAELRGKVALVTGANNPRGIGAAIALALAAQGAAIFITYLQQEPASSLSGGDEPGEAMYAQGQAQDAGHVVHAIRDGGSRAEMAEADLSDPATPAWLFDQAEQRLGPVAVLVNNAAYSTADTFLPSDTDLINTHSVEWLSSGVATLTADSHDRHFAVNARATALMMTEFARRHIVRGADWGRIINISTDGAYCFPSEIAYGASKLALESYSRSAAVELGQYGITVNIVSPGPIQTGWITANMENDIAARTPLGRVGYPEDVADVAVFLASEQARWLTGQTLHVGGGHRM